MNTGTLRFPSSCALFLVHLSLPSWQVHVHGWITQFHCHPSGQEDVEERLLVLGALELFIIYMECDRRTKKRPRCDRSLP